MRAFRRETDPDVARATARRRSWGADALWSRASSTRLDEGELANEIADIFDAWSLN